MSASISTSVFVSVSILLAVLCNISCGRKIQPCHQVNCSECEDPSRENDPSDFCCGMCKLTTNCTLGNTIIRSGVRFKVGCNLCACAGGSIHCKDTCKRKPKLGGCPKYTPPEHTNVRCIDREHECSSDFDCEGVTRCCTNGCKRQCVRPPGCEYKGRIMRSGSVFRKGFDICRCKSNGDISCLKERLRNLGILAL